MRLTRRWFFFPALSLGIVILLAAIWLRHRPISSPLLEPVYPVKTVSLSPRLIAPIAVGYGYLFPKQQWKGIAEVSGKVLYLHPYLEKGQWLPKGTILLRIDSADYVLQLEQAKAQLASSKSSLMKLIKQHDYLIAARDIEQRRQSLSEKDWQRQLNLRKKGLASQADVDRQQLQLLAQEKMVVDINNQLSVFHQDRDVLQAQIDRDEAKVQEARLTLSKTTLRLPYDAYIDDVSVELNQLVTLQQTMVATHQTGIMHVEAQVPGYQFQLLLDSLLVSKTEGNVDISGLSAVLELKSGNQFIALPARVIRVLRSVDTQRGTIGVLLETSSELQPQLSRFLIKGAFVKAIISGVSHSQWVVPGRTLHGDAIYLKNTQNRLEIRPVEVVYRVNDQVVIRGNLHSDVRLIVTDLLPAIAGMSLRELPPVGQP